MTELQLAINSLKAAISGGNVLLDKMEAKQKDLEKPPPHKWKHGDVYKTPQNNIMIYLKFAFGCPRTVCIVGTTGGLVEQGNFKDVLHNARFLFNIKEKL